MSHLSNEKFIFWFKTPLLLAKFCLHAYAGLGFDFTFALALVRWFTSELPDVGVILAIRNKVFERFMLPTRC